jgi:hypothetical protein
MVERSRVSLRGVLCGACADGERVDHSNVGSPSSGANLESKRRPHLRTPTNNEATRHSTARKRRGEGCEQRRSHAKRAVERYVGRGSEERAPTWTEYNQAMYDGDERMNEVTHLRPTSAPRRTSS